MIKALAVATVILLGSWSQMAQAAPITYLGTLQSGVPVSNSVPDGGPNNPDTADYWQFTLTEDALVTITGHRLEPGLDPSFYLFRGTFADTSEFGGSLGAGSIAELAFADDDIPALPSLAGPYSDPREIIQLPAGTYTIAFSDFLSAGPGPWRYCLELNGPADSCDQQVPMPATLLLLGLGVIGTAALRYGRF